VTLRSPRLFQFVDFLLDLRDPNQLEPLLGLQAIDLCRVPFDCRSQIVVGRLDGSQPDASVLLASPLAGPSPLRWHTSDFTLPLLIVSEET